MKPRKKKLDITPFKDLMAMFVPWPVFTVDEKDESLVCEIRELPVSQLLPNQPNPDSGALSPYMQNLHDAVAMISDGCKDKGHAFFRSRHSEADISKLEAYFNGKYPERSNAAEAIKRINDELKSCRSSKLKKTLEAGVEEQVSIYNLTQWPDAKLDQMNEIIDQYNFSSSDDEFLRIAARFEAVPEILRNQLKYVESAGIRSAALIKLSQVNAPAEMIQNSIRLLGEASPLINDAQQTLTNITGFLSKNPPASADDIEKKNHTAAQEGMKVAMATLQRLKAGTERALDGLNIGPSGHSKF